MRVLVLVESPAKVEKIKTILNSQKDGNQYIVAATVGHILELSKDKELNGLGVDLNNNYKPHYVEHSQKKDVISNLRRLKNNSDEVWIASDLDQEGEFIGYSICYLLKLPKATTRRIIFNEITKTAILRAIQNPKILDFNLLNAQKCRRVTDRLVGFLITRAAKSLNQKLTVGRVQTIMVKLVIDREKEMDNFQKTLSFHTQAIFQNTEGDEIIAKLNQTFNDPSKVQEFLVDCQASDFIVEEISERLVKKNPPAPLITSTLQSLVSRSLGISPKSVLDIAQRLYQQGIISYPRTDCPKLPEEKMDECQKYLSENFEEKYYQRREFSAKKDDSAQEAHACIYPTKIEVSELKDDEEFSFSNYEKRVYRYIWLYTVSSQMAPSETKVTKAKIEISERERERFIAENNTLTFEGYLKIWGKTAVAEEGDEDEENNENQSAEKNYAVLDLTKGEHLDPYEIESQQKASQGPAPYTESSLLTQMKKYGIGRPSTYGAILQDVQSEEKQFIYKTTKTGEKLDIQIKTWKPSANNGNIISTTKKITQNAYRNRLYSSELGRAINDFVTEYFNDIFNYHFTRDLEKKMENIEEGTIEWHQVVDELYKAFAPRLKQFPTWSSRDGPANPARKPKRQIGTSEGKNVYVYLAKYGPVIQIDEDESPQKRYITLPKEYDIEKVSLEEVRYLFGFPYELGKMEDNRTIWLKKSRYGLYLDTRGSSSRIRGKTYQVKPEMFLDYDETVSQEQQLHKLTFENARDAILDADKPKDVLRQIDDIKILEGKYGPYFIFNNVLVGIPKFHNVNLITYDECLDLYRNKLRKDGKSRASASNTTTKGKKTSTTTTTTKKKPLIKITKKIT